MKIATLFLITLFTLVSTQAFAENHGTATLNAQAPSQTIQITDQKFDPIMGEVPYETTCNREVLDHTVYSCHHESGESCSGGGEVCSTTSDSVCNSHGCTSVPRRSCHQSSQSCHPVEHEVCGDHNVYRNETYSCTKTHTVQVGQTLVKTFHHQVEVTLTPAAQAALATQMGTSLAVSVQVSENTVSAILQNPYPAAVLNYAVMPLSNDSGSSVQNSQERILVDLGLSSALAQRYSQITAENLELGSSSFRFNLKNASGLENYLALSIKLVRTPAIWFPTTVYDSTIGSSILSFNGSAPDLNINVPYEKLGIDSIRNRHSLHVTIKLNAGKVLNPGDFTAELNKQLDLDLIKANPSY